MNEKYYDPITGEELILGIDGLLKGEKSNITYKTNEFGQIEKTPKFYDKKPLSSEIGTSQYYITDEGTLVFTKNAVPPQTDSSFYKENTNRLMSNNFKNNF